VQQIHAESGSSVYAVVNGDIHIRHSHPIYRLDEFPLTPRAVDGDRARRQPSRLLNVESQVVPFSGRADELRRLAAWRDGPTSGLSVLLMHGPGGQGKSRLAARFAVDSHHAGWTVWAAHHVSDPTAALVVAPGATGRALLVVVEYAERWPMDDLQLLLQNPILRRPERARVLLISRAATSWWPALRHRLEKADVVVAESIDLGPLAQSPVGRREVFRAGRDAFAEIFGVAPQAVSEPEGLDPTVSESVLALHMAALVAVDAYVQDREVPVDQLGHSAYLLNREYDYWQSLYDHDRAFTTTPEAIARTVHVATMTGPQPTARADALIVDLGVAEPAAAHGVLTDHGRCYPTDDPDMTLEPLYPDRLGEDFLALRTPGHGYADYLPDMWAGPMPARLIELAGRDGLAELLRPAVTILIEAARRWPHVLNGQVQPILKEHPQAAVDAGGAALARLAEIDGLDHGLLERIALLLPTERHVDLDVGAARIAQILAEERLATAVDDAEQAAILLALSQHESAVGLHSQALDSSGRAVAVYRRLVQIEPGDFQHDLLRALHSHAIALSNLKQTAAAVAVAEEVVALDRARDATTSNRRSLASSLHHLSLYLSDVGRLDEALSPAQEAVDILRELSLGPSGEAFLPDLASSLDGLGTRLLELSRPADAEAPMQEALLLYRQLAEENPNSYLPDVSTSLSNLGTILTELGRYVESLRCTAESVDIDRRLAATNPGAFLPDLAVSLTNLAVDLDRAGRDMEAVTAARESLELRRNLGRTEPAAQLPGIANSLLNLSTVVSNAGDRDAFLTARQAVDAFRGLAQDNPTLYLDGLARAVNALGHQLSRAGRLSEAIVASEEAVALWRARWERDPGVYSDRLGYSLYRLGLIYGRTGQHEAGAAVAQESVDRWRALVAAAGPLHREDLARALNGLAERMWDIGRGDEALDLAQESVDLFRMLADEDPTMDLEELSEALANVARYLAGHGANERAVAAAREAVQICRPLADRSPDYYRPELADRLTNLAEVLAAGDGDLHEALESVRCALAVYEAVADRYPAAFVTEYRHAARLQTELHRRIG
jgi:tetratricopeptide (TPR) repeat protein